MSMKIKFDRNYVARIIGLTWDEVDAGIRDGWLDSAAAVDKAIQSLQQSDTYSDIELELAGLGAEDVFDIQDKVMLLVKSRKVDKSRLARLAVGWLFENKDTVEEPLVAIEELYADLDYPEEISHLVRYMPNEGEPLDLMVELEKFVHSDVYSKEVEAP